MLSPGTAAWEAVLAYSWINPAMRPSSPRTTKDIVLLDADLVHECYDWPWERLLAFYCACATLPYCFSDVVCVLDAAGLDIDNMAAPQLTRALASLQQARKELQSCMSGASSEDTPSEAEEGDLAAGEAAEAEAALDALP